MSKWHASYYLYGTGETAGEDFHTLDNAISFALNIIGRYDVEIQALAGGYHLDSLDGWVRIEWR